MSWFWARFKARSSDLGTYDGGFQAFFDDFCRILERKGVSILFHKSVEQIRSTSDGKVSLTIDGEKQVFDKVIVTTSPTSFVQLTPELSDEYKQRAQQSKSIGAVVMLLSITHPLSKEGYYWYNLPKSKEFPFLSLVEHTNFLSPSHFNVSWASIE